MSMSQALAGVNGFAVLAAALAAFAIGAVWYSPALFARAWMRATGLTEERLKQGNMAVIFGLAFALELVAALVLGLFLGPEANLAFGTAAGFMTGLFWVSGALGVVYLFERRPLALWCIDAGYQVVLFTVMGAILGAWH
jgi:Protein of unknown function (DUF1761)